MQLDIAHVARYVASFCSQLYIYCTYIIHVARYEFCQKYSTIPLIMLISYTILICVLALKFRAYLQSTVVSF